MAPKGKQPITRTTTTTRTRTRTRRSNFKKPSTPPCSINSGVTSISSSLIATSSSSIPDSGCCTPEKSRIPEMLTCPPAPKKQKVAQNCALRKRQIAFFAPPDVELFFVFSLGQQIKK